MRRVTMTGLALLALAVSAAGLARPARAATAYTLTILDGFNSDGLAVSASGQVPGSRTPRAACNTRSYRALTADRSRISGSSTRVPRRQLRHCRQRNRSRVEDDKCTERHRTVKLSPSHFGRSVRRRNDQAHLPAGL
jgi:hypothetical protein